MKQPKAHHFVPVAHLARFSASPESVPLRDRVLDLYDKRTGLFRSSKAGNVAYENDLYTIRAPQLAGVEPKVEQIIRAVFNPANKDAEIEGTKVGIERGGLDAIREIDAWDVGPRQLADDHRAALVTYVGLLLAQHPTMMAARAAAIRRKFLASVPPKIAPISPLNRAFDEFSAGAGVLALVMDAFAAAFELNYLGWRVIRWPEGGLVLGDIGVAVSYLPGIMGAGDPWTDGAAFHLPISATTLIVMGALAPGTCIVEARAGGDAAAEVAAVNCISWARSRAEVYSGRREDLEETLAMMRPQDHRADHSMQVDVRESVLPGFAWDSDGGLELVWPPDPSPDETHRRFVARFSDGR